MYVEESSKPHFNMAIITTNIMITNSHMISNTCSQLLLGWYEWKHGKVYTKYCKQQIQGSFNKKSNI